MSGVRCASFACGLLGLVLVAPAPAWATRLDEAPRAPGWTRAAAAPEPQPLTGSGEGLRVVANLPLDASDVAASDLELHGDHAFIGSYSEGLVIADVSDPTRPRRVGRLPCGGGSQYDVQLSGDANLVLLTTDSSGASCLPAGTSGSMVIDATDRANPRLLSLIETEVGSHTHTLDDRTLYINNYPSSYSKLEIFDLTDPAQPRKLSELSFGGQSSVHDSYVDHRPDGRTLLYAASIGFTDVIDVTDRRAPRLLQRLADPTVTVSHQAEPNHARDTLVVTDEFLGGQDAPLCGQLPVRQGEGPLTLPELGDPTDLGAIHFYRLGADGTMVSGGTGDGKIGTYNLPVQLNPSGGCTVHVFWQAPDVNRLVAGWYGRGTHVVDFTDPSQPRSLGHVIPTGANTWAAKPHRVGGKAYVFTGDIARGMDVLEFTGEGWPATAAPQEAQRRRIQGLGEPLPAGAPTPAPAGAPRPATRRGAALRVRVRVPRARAARVTLTVRVLDARRRLVAKLRFRVRPGRVATLRARLRAHPGRHRYVVRMGERGRVLRRGTLQVRAAAGAAAGGTPRLVCRIVS